MPPNISTGKVSPYLNGVVPRVATLHVWSLISKQKIEKLTELTTNHHQLQEYQWDGTTLSCPGGEGLNPEDNTWKQLPTDPLRQVVAGMFVKRNSSWYLLLSPWLC